MKNVFALLAFFAMQLYAMEEKSLSIAEQNFLQAAVCGDEQKISEYLQKLVSINTHDQFGENALFKAVYHKRWKVATLLIAQGIDVNFHPHNKGNNTTYLHILCFPRVETPENKDAASNLLQVVLTKYNANPNPLDRHGQTPLDSAYHNKNEACTKILENAGGTTHTRLGKII